MIALAWTLGSIATYFAIGLGVAAWDMPQLHKRLSHSSEYRTWESRARAARGFAYLTILFWPARGPYLAVARLADKHNPNLIALELQRREQEIADRELEIRKMERQMQIGKETK